MKAVLKKGPSGKWYWSIVAANNKILCHSETYSSKAKAVQTFNKIAELFRQGSMNLSLGDPKS